MLIPGRATEVGKPPPSPQSSRLVRVHHLSELPVRRRVNPGGRSHGRRQAGPRHRPSRRGHGGPAWGLSCVSATVSCTSHARIQAFLVTAHEVGVPSLLSPRTPELGTGPGLPPGDAATAERGLERGRAAPHCSLPLQGAPTGAVLLPQPCAGPARVALPAPGTVCQVQGSANLRASSGRGVQGTWGQSEENEVTTRGQQPTRARLRTVPETLLRTTTRSAAEDAGSERRTACPGLHGEQGGAVMWTRLT